MKKVDVIYDGGQSRYSDAGVDYMICEIDGVELYAEAEPFEDDVIGTYEGLKAEIIRQARAAGISPESLHFDYDDDVEIPAGPFYRVITAKRGDEFTDYEGFDLEAAKKAAQATESRQRLERHPGTVELRKWTRKPSDADAWEPDFDIVDYRG